MDDSTVQTDKLEQEVEESVDKQTNRTFTQSDVDKMVAETIKKERDKTGDVGAIKAELEELRKAKKESELAKMDEVERLKIQLQEQEKEKLETQKEAFALKKRVALNELLSDPKYSKMPKAYKNMVAFSEDSEEMVRSAESAFAEFENDFGGEMKSTFGIPSGPAVDPVKSARTVIRGAGDMQAALKAQIAEKLKRK